MIVVPRQSTRGRNGRIILLYALSETFEFGDMADLGCCDPLFQILRSAIPEDAQEGLTQLIGTEEILTGLTYLLELSLLSRGELFFGKDKEPGGFLGRKPLALGSGHWSLARCPFAG